jgi:hypothetical protein
MQPATAGERALLAGSAGSEMFRNAPGLVRQQCWISFAFAASLSLGALVQVQAAILATQHQFQLVFSKRCKGLLVRANVYHICSQIHASPRTCCAGSSVRWMLPSCCRCTWRGAKAPLARALAPRFGRGEPRAGGTAAAQAPARLRHHQAGRPSHQPPCQPGGNRPPGRFLESTRPS